MNYADAYTNPSNPYHSEAVRLASTVRSEARFDATGVVLRWKSNNAPVPSDIADFAAYLGIPVNLKAHAIARSRHEEAVLNRYIAARANRSADEIAEENYERRAAFGPGVRLVNVFTGEESIS